MASGFNTPVFRSYWFASGLWNIDLLVFIFSWACLEQFRSLLYASFNAILNYNLLKGCKLQTHMLREGMLTFQKHWFDRATSGKWIVALKDIRILWQIRRPCIVVYQQLGALIRPRASAGIIGTYPLSLSESRVMRPMKWDTQRYQVVVFLKFNKGRRDPTLLASAPSHRREHPCSFHHPKWVNVLIYVKTN